MAWKAAVVLAFLTMPASALELRLDEGTLSGKDAALKVTLAAGKDLPTGVQFDLEYDPAALGLTVELGQAAQQASKNLRSAEIKPGKLRVLIIGFNRTTISDGVIAVVHVSYKGTETGKTFPVQMTAAAGTDADARPLVVTAKDGSVKVEK
jgi:hypothetical protein